MMAQLITLLIALIGLTIICLNTSKHAIVSPQFGFTVCFIPGIVYAFVYVRKWDLNLSGETVWAIILGVSIFVIVSLAVSKLYPKFKKKNKTLKISLIGKERISNKKLLLVLIFQLVTLILTIYFLRQNYGSDLSMAMATFRRYAGHSDDYIALPGLIKMFRRISLSAGFISLYIFVRGLVYKDESYRLFSLFCIVGAILNGLILGARGDAIQLIAAGIVQFLLLNYIKNGRKHIKVKSFVRIFVLILAIILSFAEVGELMGRNMSFLKFGDYIAVYLSAELKNLDTFVRIGSFGAPISDSQTMANISKLLSIISGDPSIEHSLTNPYRFVNGYSLGNVSTTFYGFLYDGGFWGIILFTTLMAFVCQIVFQKALKSKIEKKIDMNIIIYSYLWYTIVFSFFSDKFYEMIFNTAFLWFVVGCILIRLLFTTSIKSRGIKR